MRVFVVSGDSRCHLAGFLRRGGREFLTVAKPKPRARARARTANDGRRQDVEAGGKKPGSVRALSESPR